MTWILQSNRLNFRKITKDDFENLKPILQDTEIMYAWEHGFSDEEVYAWIDKNLLRYKNEGYSYFAAIEKDTNAFIGAMGPLIEKVNDISHVGIAYILNKKYWGKGYAVDGAQACMNYAFNILNAPKVIAQIRTNNLPSRKVAERLNMHIEGEFVKHYNNMDMPHLIYARLADLRIR